MAPQIRENTYMKKFWKLAATAATASLLVAACGSSSSSDTTVASSDTTASGDGFTLANFTPFEGGTVVDLRPFQCRRAVFRCCR